MKKLTDVSDSCVLNSSWFCGIIGSIDLIYQTVHGIILQEDEQKIG